VIDTGVKSFRPIKPSRADTCETQRQVAAHNSVYDTLRTGKRVVYMAACEEKALAMKPGAKEAAE
jgi:hypothetical protein